VDHETVVEHLSIVEDRVTQLERVVKILLLDHLVTLGYVGTREEAKEQVDSKTFAQIIEFFELG
jgi:hypothetical protein